MRGNHAAFLGVVVLMATSTFSTAGYAQQTSRDEEPTPVEGLELTLDRAVELAVGQNPDFEAALGRLRAARGDVRSARTYRFNPSIELDAPGAESALDARPFEARLEQQLEWSGARGLRIGASERGLAAERSRAADNARLLVAEVGRVFYALAAAEERLRVTRELSGLNQRLQAAVVIQLAEGEVSRLQGNLALIEAARARALVLDQAREVEAVRLELARLLGLPSEQRLETVGAGADPPVDATQLSGDSLVAIALSRRPDLGSRTSREAQTHYLARLATRSALPTVSVAGLVTRDAASSTPRYGVSFTVPVPLFDRNQGVRDRARAEVLVANQERRATELRIRAEVAAALWAYRAGSEETEILRRDLLVPVRENQLLLEVAYREGKIDLPTLLLLRNQLLDAELTYWGAWMRQRQAWVALEAATAANPEVWMQALDQRSEVTR